MFSIGANNSVRLGKYGCTQQRKDHTAGMRSSPSARYQFEPKLPCDFVTVYVNGISSPWASLHRKMLYTISAKSGAKFLFKGTFSKRVSTKFMPAPIIGSTIQ